MTPMNGIVLREKGLDKHEGSTQRDLLHVEALVCDIRSYVCARCKYYHTLYRTFYSSKIIKRIQGLEPSLGRLRQVWEYKIRGGRGFDTLGISIRF